MQRCLKKDRQKCLSYAFPKDNFLIRSTMRRVLPVRNRSTAQLLSREMEILCNDQIYQEAVAMAAQIIDR